MAEKNNNTLLVIAIIAVIIAAIAFFVTYGKFFAFQRVLLAPTGPGNVTVTIAQNLDINVTPNIINWGSGYVDPNFNNATLSTHNGAVDRFLNVTPGSVTPDSVGFNVENVGNVNASIDIATDKNAATFIGGGSPTPEYQFNVSRCSQVSCVTGAGVKNDVDNAVSCTNSTGGSNMSSTYFIGTYANVNTTSPGTRVCDVFRYDPDSNQLRIDIRVVIPQSAPTTQKNSTMTITATAVP